MTLYKAIQILQTAFDLMGDDEAVFVINGKDYLEYFPREYPWLVISNPPFSLASEFILHTMRDVLHYQGFCIFLLRLNFLGGQKRKKLFEEFKPKYVFVHSKRPSFAGGQTDSIEYAHFVWQQGYHGNTILEIL